MASALGGFGRPPWKYRWTQGRRTLCI